MKKIKTEIPTNITIVNENEEAQNDPEITIKLSEYSKLQKQNFIANVVMQYIYNNCRLYYDNSKLRFDNDGLNEVLAAVDKEYYDKVLAIKRDEQKEREDEREENRSEEE